jgi:hypothetical protein
MARRNAGQRVETLDTDPLSRAGRVVMTLTSLRALIHFFQDRPERGNDQA